METALKLQKFAEIASNRTLSNTTILWRDANDNKEQAENYLQNELGFLSGRDWRELKEVWNHTCRDGRDSRLLFSAVKTLQERYK